MPSNTSDPCHETLKIKHDKLSSSLLSREASIANPSFRVYYGGATGAIPFVWESQPGMPKNAVTNTRLPPLTPPPSYQSKKIKNCTKKSPKTTLIQDILRRLTLRRNHPRSPPSPISFSSTSLLSSSSSCMSSVGSHRCSRFSSSSSSYSSQGDPEAADGSPRSISCFGVRRTYSAVLSIVGHGSDKGTSALNMSRHRTGTKILY